MSWLRRWVYLLGMHDTVWSVVNSVPLLIKAYMASKVIGVRAQMEGFTTKRCALMDLLDVITV